MVRMLIRFAIKAKIRTDDPTLGIKTIKIKNDGFQIWDSDQIAIYRAKYAIGTRPRLALELLINGAAA